MGEISGRWFLQNALTMNRFKAPWGKSLRIMTGIGTVICLAASLFFFRTILTSSVHTVYFCLSVLPLLLVAGAALFTVRGYSVSGDSIFIERLFWSTRLPVAGLQSVRFEPDAVRGSIRAFGNGGFFSVTGYYWNKRLGSYRAYVTDPRRIVVLRFSKRAVVLSPDSPEDFVRVLSPYAINAG
jgi:hypothetical protein